MKIATPMQLAATAFHEVGHSVACVLRGARIVESVVYEQARNGTFGHTKFTGLAKCDDSFVAFAGPWFEAMLRSNGDEPSLPAIRASLASNGSDRCDLDDTGRSIPRQFEPQYLALAPVVRDLAVKMLDRDDLRLTDADVRAALGINAEGSNLPVIRSMVASGVPVGSFTAA